MSYWDRMELTTYRIYCWQLNEQRRSKLLDPYPHYFIKDYAKNQITNQSTLTVNILLSDLYPTADNLSPLRCITVALIII